MDNCLEIIHKNMRLLRPILSLQNKFSDHKNYNKDLKFEANSPESPDQDSMNTHLFKFLSSEMTNQVICNSEQQQGRC